MATQIPLGEKFYLFTPANDFNAEEDHLLISAHGGYTNLKGPLGTSSFEVPKWVQLHFYASHGNSLNDPTVYGIMKGQVQVKETSGPGTRVTNYSLSKYQGRHGSANETYGSIGGNIDQNVGVVDDIGRFNLSRNFGFRFSVLTVRNRRFRSDPSLSDALAALATAGYRFENIHCSFCRSSMFGSGTESAAVYGT